jgi:hypothetical protein
MGRAQQAAAGVFNCSFVQQFDSRVDIVLSVDSFEHFGRPDEVLKEMAFEVETGRSEEISRGCRRLEPTEHPQI